jgi:RNA polymerase sigma-70 factor (ECF subfamily)
VSSATEGKGERPQGSGDGELVAAAKRGELGAFDTLVGRYQRQATSVAYRLLNNMDDAMEITQDAFLQAYDKLATLSKPERFGPWLMRITSNLALNRRRWRSLRKSIPLEGLGDGDEDRGEMQLSDPSAVMPDQAASAEDVKKIMADVIAELPEMQRQALMMFCIDELPQKEIAQHLGCSVEAVKWHVFTARKKLKERLKDYL